MSNIYCGIDFGTSNSSIAIAASNIKPKLIQVENSKTTIPSTIFYENGKASPVFGEYAISSYTNGDQGRFMRSLKRVLGTDLMEQGTIVNSKSVKFENILAQFIKYLKNKAEAETNSEIKNVVMGRPVHFRDNDKKGDDLAQKQLENIAKMVGFENIVFQFEPIAAAYAHEEKILEEKLAIVIDIGGGTSDFSILKLGKNLQQKKNREDDILASSGVRIGGNDFDKNLSIASFMPELGYKTTYSEKNLVVPSSFYFI